MKTRWRFFQRYGEWAIFFAAFAGLSGLVAAVGAMRASDSEESVLSGPVVESLPLKLEDGYIVETRNLGRAEAARRSALGFELDGMIEAIKVDIGDTVEAGAPLAALDTARLRAARREAEAVVRTAEAELAKAESELKRVRTLLGAAVASPRESDEAVRVRDATAASRDAAVGALERIETDISKTRLVAPFAGVVVARLRDEGEVVGAGVPVIELIETSRMRVRAGIPPEIAREWRSGTRVACERDGHRFEGIIERVVPARDPSTRTWEVVVAIGESDAQDGDLVAVVTERRHQSQGYWVPREALSESSRGLWGAYVLIGGETGFLAELRPVEIVYSRGDRAFVRGALRPGEALVTKGAHKLVPGVRISDRSLAGVAP
ncbi:MAG: efflux RND transporter periplasmic adaptor subunit [Verrucomicrobiia bacterium]